MTEITGFSKSKTIMLEMLGAIDSQDNREELAQKFALAVALRTFMDMMRQLPADAAQKAALEVQSEAITQGFLDEVYNYFTPDQKTQIFERNMQSELSKFMEGMKPTLTPDQLAKLQAIADRISATA